MFKVSNKGNQNENDLIVHIHRVNLASNEGRIQNPAKRLRWSRSLRAVKYSPRKLQLMC